MNEADADSMAETPEPRPKAAAGGREDRDGVRQAFTVEKEESSSKTMKLMEQVVERENLREALKRVVANKGAPGIDGMTVEELAAYLKRHWPRLRRELLEAQYVPKPVRAVDIPKPGGGTRRPSRLRTPLHP